MADAYSNIPAFLKHTAVMYDINKHGQQGSVNTQINVNANSQVLCLVAYTVRWAYVLYTTNLQL
jgi:hypothetical protein